MVLAMTVDDIMIRETSWSDLVVGTFWAAALELGAGIIIFAALAALSWGMK
jgi:hypothetical protein